MKIKHWTTEKIISRVLSNKNQTNYWNYITELRSRVNKKVYNIAFELTKSSIDKEKILGIYILAQLGFDPRFQQKKTILRYFYMLQEEQSPKVLVALFSSIAHNNHNLNEVQIEKLASFKNHPNIDVRFDLSLALSGIEHKTAIHTLIQLSKDKHHDVRNWATFGLGTQIETDTPEIRNALWQNIEDTHQDTRFEAMVGLANRKDQRIFSVLKTKLEAFDEDNYHILDPIEKLQHEDFIPLLEAKINTNTSDTHWNETAKEVIKILKTA
ncbi:MAG: HEAT repeat domain-containing protein [Kordia sp.]|uniref:hypothetical protein n=1 Tax=Kordia sp. TaxID=1965332 RepID=UPI00385C69AE